MTSPKTSSASIASSQLTPYGCGSSRCPLIVDVAPGQNVNVTVIVFRNASDVTLTSCDRLLSIKRVKPDNNRVEIVHEVTSCASDDVRRIEFTVRHSGRLLFDVTMSALVNQRPRFIFTYTGEIFLRFKSFHHIYHCYKMYPILKHARFGQESGRLSKRLTQSFAL